MAEVARPRILLVDDDAPFVEALSVILEGAGYELTVAGDATGALAASAITAFDLVITDVQMPGRSGLELTRELAMQRPNLPVILLSGVTMLPDGASARTSFLVKPVSSRTLLQAVQDALHPV